MEADALVAAALASIPRAQIAALIDLTSGLFLAVEPVPDDTSTLDLFAATVKEIYDGELSEGLRISAAGAASRSAPSSKSPVNVIVVSGDEALSVMVRMHAQPHLVLAVGCPASANLGMSMVKARHLASTHAVEGI